MITIEVFDENRGDEREILSSTSLIPKGLAPYVSDSRSLLKSPAIWRGFQTSEGW